MGILGRLGRGGVSFISTLTYLCVHIVDKTMAHHGPMPPVTGKPGPKGLAPTQLTSQGTDSVVGPLEIQCGEGRKQVSEVPASSEC